MDYSTLTEEELLAKDEEVKAMAQAIEQAQKNRVDARAEQLYQSLSTESDAVKKSLYNRLRGDYDPQLIAERRRKEGAMGGWNLALENEASRKR